MPPPAPTGLIRPVQATSPPQATKSFDEQMKILQAFSQVESSKGPGPMPPPEKMPVSTVQNKGEKEPPVETLPAPRTMEPFGPNQFRLQRMGEGGTPLGRTPVPSARELQNAGHNHHHRQ